MRWNRGQKHGMPASRNPADETRRVPIPPSETGPVPVAVKHAEPRWFGVPPPLLLLGLTLASFAIAIACFAAGSWPAGLVLLGMSALFAAVFLEVARRRPDSTLTHASSSAVVGARTWAGSQFEVLRARSSAIAESQRVHGARAVIESERRMARLRLGEALRSHDLEGVHEARERLSELDRSEGSLEGRIEARRAQADERIRRVRLSVEQTMVKPPDDTRRPAA